MYLIDKAGSVLVVHGTLFLSDLLAALDWLLRVRDLATHTVPLCGWVDLANIPSKLEVVCPTCLLPSVSGIGATMDMASRGVLVTMLSTWERNTGDLTLSVVGGCEGPIFWLYCVVPLLGDLLCLHTTN